MSINADVQRYTENDTLTLMRTLVPQEWPERNKKTTIKENLKMKNNFVDMSKQRLKINEKMNLL